MQPQACAVPERHPEERFSPHGPAIKHHMDPRPFLTNSSPRTFIFLSNLCTHLKSVCECVQTQNRTNIRKDSHQNGDGDGRPRNCKNNVLDRATMLAFGLILRPRGVAPPPISNMSKTNWFSYKCTFGAHPTGPPQRSVSWYRRVRARGQNYQKCTGSLTKSLAPTCAPL